MPDRIASNIDLSVSQDTETAEYTVKCRWRHPGYCEVSYGIGDTLADAFRDLAHEMDAPAWARQSTEFDDAFRDLAHEMDGHVSYQGHMPLRDWFAGKALDGLLSNCPHDAPRLFPDQAAVEAYEYADAMLVRRKGYQA